MQGLVAVVAVLFIVTNLLVDLAYRFVDPRVRVEEAPTHVRGRLQDVQRRPCVRARGDRAARRAGDLRRLASHRTTRTSRTSPAASQGPSADYWLGTDHLGRDVLSRLIDGTRVGLTLAIPVIAIALVIGLSVGLASGYHGGARRHRHDLRRRSPRRLPRPDPRPDPDPAARRLDRLADPRAVDRLRPAVRARHQGVDARRQGARLRARRAGARREQLAHHVPAHPAQHHPVRSSCWPRSTSRS